MRSVEVELKLSVKTDLFVKTKVIAAVRNRLFQLPNHYTSPQHLTNIYFETPDNQLRRWDMGLRIRGFGEQYEMTMKTAGKVIAGLHQRPEFNVPLQQPKLDLARFPADIWPEKSNLAQLQADLAEMFSTNFSREKWLVTYGLNEKNQSEIEVVLDQGEIRSGEKSSPICEFELELKTGQISDVLALADELALQGGLRLENKSKAARGYALVKGKLSTELTQLSEITQEQQPLSVLLTHILHQWQEQEERWLAGISTGKTELAQVLACAEMVVDKQEKTAPALILLPALKEALSATDADAQEVCYRTEWLQCKLALTQWLIAHH
ncbi:MAG: CYTH domain-containing protein [Enterobacteriaceae bacterium]|jgi:triphosphatase|nr:CYTH domain-containing protein [Enterobacteriaceae bacterium]